MYTYNTNICFLLYQHNVLFTKKVYSTNAICLSLLLINSLTLLSTRISRPNRIPKFPEMLLLLTPSQCDTHKICSHLRGSSSLAKHLPAKMRSEDASGEHGKGPNWNRCINYFIESLVLNGQDERRSATCSVSGMRGRACRGRAVARAAQADFHARTHRPASLVAHHLCPSPWRS